MSEIERVCGRLGKNETALKLKRDKKKKKQWENFSSGGRGGNVRGYCSERLTAAISKLGATITFLLRRVIGLP